MNAKHIENKLLEIDNQILLLAHKKIDCLKQYAAHSRENRQSVANVLLKKMSHVLDFSKLPKEESLKFMEALFDKGFSLPKPRVSFLGPEGTFSHCAALSYFGQNMQPVTMQNFNAIFESMAGDSDLAIVPVENSIEGAVSLNLDLLIDSPVFVVGEIILPVDHHLMSYGKMFDVRAVYSHPQILAQCRKWLDKNLKNIKIFETSSSAAAFQFIEKNKQCAMIGNEMISKLYKVPVLKGHIQDDNTNQTRFWVLSKEKNFVSHNTKTSIVFLCEDKPGSLLQVLKVFKNRNINLTKIESRPSKRKVWEYYFFVDILGDENNPEIKSALKTVRSKTSYLKILGSYGVNIIERDQKNSLKNVKSRH